MLSLSTTFYTKIPLWAIFYPFTVAHFILQSIVYTLLYTITGLCIRSSDQLQYAQLPVTIILFLSYGVGYYALIQPASILSIVAMYVPFTLPFVVSSEALSKNCNLTEIIVCCFIVTFFSMICNYFIIHVFIPHNRMGEGIFLKTQRPKLPMATPHRAGCH